MRTTGDHQQAVQNEPASKCIHLRGMPVHVITETQVLQHIFERLSAHSGGWVITPNLDHLRRHDRDEEFARHYQQADLVLADGMPLVWASKLQGTPLPERVPGSGLIISLSKAAAAAKRSIFLMGGDPGTAEAAGKELKRRFPGLQIAGSACPAVGFDTDRAQLQMLREQLSQSGADIVFVALGSPKQEKIIAELRGSLPAAWWLGVGISFSFVCGEVRRAPLWLQRCGLEWTHRLVQEPRRLARRYLVDGLPFAAVLFTDIARERFFQRSRSIRRDGQ